MTRIRNFLFSTTFRNIIIIFTVGLTSRILINYYLDVNVFKEYTSYISLSYFFSMASFTVFINSLPSINWDVFNIRVVKESIRLLLFGNNNYMIVDDNFNRSYTHNANDKPVTEFFTKDSDSKDKYKTHKSHKGVGSRAKPSVHIPGAGAALYGLYDVNPAKSPSNGVRTSNLIYDLYDFDKQKIRKQDISYPYNPKGTLLSNRGSNHFGYPNMSYGVPDAQINSSFQDIINRLNHPNSIRNKESVCNSLMDVLQMNGRLRDPESVRNSIMSHLNNPSSARNVELVRHSITSYLNSSLPTRDMESVRNSIMSYLANPLHARNPEPVRNSLTSYSSSNQTGSITIGLDNSLNTVTPSKPTVNSKLNTGQDSSYLRPDVYNPNRNTNTNGSKSNTNCHAKPVAPNAPKLGHESNVPSYYQRSSLNSRQTVSNPQGLGMKSAGSHSLLELELSRRKEKVLEALNNKEVIQGKRSSREEFYFTGSGDSSVKLSLNYSSSDNKKNLLESVFFKFYERGKRTYH